VVGAGCIGAWTGAQLARVGAEITLIGRPSLAEPVARAGLIATSLTAPDAAFGPGGLRVALGPEAVAGAGVVVVAVKGGSTSAAAAEIRPHLAPGAVVVSLQNGLRNPDRLREALPDHAVVPGMVSFNVVWDQGPGGRARLRQTTSGPIALERGGSPALAEALRASGVPVVEPADMQGVQWAKLLLNLNNAVNALSGRGLKAELSDRGYRRVLAAAMTEAWAVLKAAGVRPVPIGKMRPALAPRILPLPDWLFRALAAPMIRIDPAARSSMADDLARGRPTEVGDINGEVVALGHRVGVPTPVNARLVALVRAVEAGEATVGLPAARLWPTG
jgi:2-dehydropantoate 2-reductase